VPDTLPLQSALADHYQLQQPLGRGAMATVYLARDLRHGRYVALKVMRPELAATVAGDRFLREIHLAGRLQHPHIVPMLESGEARGQLWYTMPYIRGESLRQLLDRERALPIGHAVEVARQIALALDYAHGEGVVHRDLKPENILLEYPPRHQGEAGGYGQALIADFGVAKALESGGERLTGSGMLLGTAAYISPEQASSGEVDGRADLYSLGCLLYEMLTGVPPFTGPTVQKIIAQRFRMAPPSVRRLSPEVPETLDATVRRLLALNPDERFASGAAVAQALLQPVPDGPVDAPPAGLGKEALTTWAARWAVPLVLAAILGLLGQGMLAK
jgi:serine/threonine-protein kinase